MVRFAAFAFRQQLDSFGAADSSSCIRRGNKETVPFDPLGKPFVI